MVPKDGTAGPAGSCPADEKGRDACQSQPRVWTPGAGQGRGAGIPRADEQRKVRSGGADLNGSAEDDRVQGQAGIRRARRQSYRDDPARGEADIQGVQPLEGSGGTKRRRVRRCTGEQKFLGGKFPESEEAGGGKNRRGGRPHRRAVRRFRRCGCRRAGEKTDGGKTGSCHDGRGNGRENHYRGHKGGEKLPGESGEHFERRYADVRERRGHGAEDRQGDRKQKSGGLLLQRRGVFAASGKLDRQGRRTHRHRRTQDRFKSCGHACTDAEE